MAFASQQTAFSADYNTQYASVSPGAQNYNAHFHNAPYQTMSPPAPTYNHDYKGPQNTVAAGPQSPSTVATTHFSHGRQAFQLARSYLFRWIVTVGISAAFAGVVLAYQNKGGLNSDDKHYFNGVTAGLIILLSLNLMASLNSMARALKWRLLAGRAHPPRLFQLLVAFDSSQMKPLRLALMPHRFIGLRILCIIWLLINLLAGIGTAAVGLAYSMDAQTGTEYSTLLTSQTTGRTAVFTNIGGRGVGGAARTSPAGSPANISAQRDTAFDYGIGGVYLAYEQITSDDPSESFDAIHFETDKERYRLRVVDYSDDPTADDLFNVLSERTIYNNASCEEVAADIDTTSTISQGLTNITFTMTNGSAAYFAVERPAGGAGAMYIADTEQACGPRCTQMYALVTLSDSTYQFYRCWSEVSAVMDLNTDQPITRPELQLPDLQAQIIAGSIAWGGIAVAANIDGSFLPVPRYQAAFYGNASTNSPTLLVDATFFADVYVAAFPASVLAILNRNGPQQSVDDIIVRQEASDLHVHWDRFMMCLGFIAGVQALLAIMTILVTFMNRIIVHDDAPFALATLLGTNVAHVRNGTLANGEVIARSIRSDLIYTHLPTESPREPHSVVVNDGAYHQDMKFPAGEYL